MKYVEKICISLTIRQLGDDVMMVECGTWFCFTHENQRVV